MNILILCTHLNPGGIARYVITLAKALKAEGHKVWLASCGGQWLDKLKVLGIGLKIIPIKTKSIVSFKILLSLFSLLPLIVREKIEIIHANTRVTQALGFMLYKLTHTPYISSFHGYYRPTFFRRVIKLSGAVSLAVSEAVKKHLVEDLKFKSKKVYIVYNGIDNDEFPATGNKNETPRFNEGHIFIGILGRISEEKGHFLAAHALKLLSAKYKSVYLMISGRGKLEYQLRLFIKAIEIEDRVRFVELEGSDFYDAIDILIVPSQKEGFGYTVIEAFAREVPVIGFNVGGIAELIRDRENGLLFYTYEAEALAACIEELMLKPSLRAKLIQNAKKDVAFFSAERMARQTEEVYRVAMR